MHYKIIKYIQGTVTITLISGSPERFFNICAQRDLLIWDVMHVGSYYQFKMKVKDFKSTKEILKKTDSRFKILKKEGLPFFLYKNRRKKGFAVGCSLFLVLLYCLSFFIWDISLEGNYSYSEGEIVDFLEQNNIVHGLLKKNIDCDAIEKSIRNKYFDITWVCAEINGTRLIIHIKENFDSEVVQKETDPYNLTANKEAVITSIVTRSGTPFVKVGDEVKTDDVLVSGAVNIYDDFGEVLRTSFVNADADIYGKTSYEYNDKFSLNYIEKRYTGQEFKNYYTDFSKYKLLFQMKENTFLKYDEFSDDTHLKVLRNYYLPFHFGTCIYKEYEEIEKNYTKKEAEVLANEKLALFLDKLEKKGIQILENNVTIETNGRYCRAMGEIVVIEKLGKVTTIETINEEGQIEDEHN